jgi:hypothetical protein
MCNTNQIDKEQKHNSYSSSHYPPNASQLYTESLFRLLEFYPRVNTSLSPLFSSSKASESKDLIDLTNSEKEEEEQEKKQYDMTDLTQNSHTTSLYQNKRVSQTQ